MPVPSLWALLLLALPLLADAQGIAPERSRVPDQYKWKLADLYPSDEHWARAKEALPARIEAFAKRRGTLGAGPRAVAAALTEMGALQNELERIQLYAQLRNDEDTRRPLPRAMRLEAEGLGVNVDAATSFVRPELLSLPAAKLKAAMAEPRLRDWRFYLEEVLRWKPHTLPAEQERLVSLAGELTGAPQVTEQVLVDADLPFPTVKLSSGEEMRIDTTGYEKERSAPVRADRVRVFRAFFGALQGYQRTLGSTLYAQVKAHVFEQEAHRFGSTLEAALFREAIPAAIYQQLIRDVNANLGTLHRYLALRRRMMGLERLEYEDLYTPLVRKVDRSYTVEEAKEAVLAAVAPLGNEYQSKLRQGYESGWTDFLPSTGKRSGAYSDAVYGTHPFQLLNFNGQWEDVVALAHESGHSMHFLLSFEHQPYPASRHPLFAAEVASTLNEYLLNLKAEEEASSDDERLAFLGARLERMRTVLFRQTLFAEFELAVHRAVEKGEALTGEGLSQMYLELVRRYYGHDQGVCDVDELYGVEWAFIPHLYLDYYVYQYATSVVASTFLGKAIRAEEAKGSTATRDRYLAMLSSGGSAHPVELLERAGVDMTTSAPFQAAMADMNETMDQMESILSRRAGQ